MLTLFDFDGLTTPDPYLSVSASEDSPLLQIASQAFLSWVTYSLSQMPLL